MKRQFYCNSTERVKSILVLSIPGDRTLNAIVVTIQRNIFQEFPYLLLMTLVFLPIQCLTKCLFSS